MKQITIAAIVLIATSAAASADQRCYVGSKKGRVSQETALIACDQIRGGGTNILIEKGYGIIKFGPATYDECVEWILENED